MSKLLRISTIAILSISFIATLCLMMFQNMVSLMAIPTAILFLYYLVVLYLVTLIQKGSPNKSFVITVWVLFLIPLLWCLVAPYHLFEFLSPNIKLDMK